MTSSSGTPWASASRATSENTRAMLIAPLSCTIFAAANTASMINAPTKAIAAGSTLVLGVPGGFLPLKNGKAEASPEIGETQA